MFPIAQNLLIDNTRRRSHDALVRAVRRDQRFVMTTTMTDSRKYRSMNRLPRN